jgi:hypothetical protein
VRTFFIPGSDDDSQLAERVYADLRTALELELGTRPSAQRIAKVWTRRGGADCVTEVGVADPLHGGTVLAIFDMGQHQPFVVWWRPHGGIPTRVREILSHHAYAVVEFDS